MTDSKLPQTEKESRAAGANPAVMKAATTTSTPLPATATDTPKHDPGQWFLVKMVNAVKQQQAVLRLRVDRPSVPDISSFTQAISLQWAYQSDRGGMPTDDDLKRMQNLEDAMAELSVDNGHSYLMNVATGMGLREWLYYAKDRDRFMLRFNQLLRGKPRYPLNIEFYNDPEWTLWHEVREAYERGGGQPANAS